jgi:hypothetical protein
MKLNDLDKVASEKDPDSERLEHIQEWLQTRLRPAGSSSDIWIDDSFNFCLSLIEALRDENQSLWLMLDELKSSEMESWAKDNEEMLKEYLDEHIKKLKWSNKLLGEA